MNENESTSPDVTTGQASAPDSISTGQSGFQPKEASITQSEQAPSTQTQAQAEETFYADFNSLPAEKQEELRPYYKQMQAAFTKKAQDIAGQRKAYSQKIQAYDQFMANPVENIMRMGQQYGLNLTPAQAQQVAQQHAVNPDWAPNAWEEVFDKSGEYFMPKVDERIQQRLSAYEEKIALLERRESERTAASAKAALDKIDPNWQMYEDEMRQNLERHPTLAHDVAQLYRMSVPEEVLAARAKQEMAKKYDQKVQAARVEGSSRSNVATSEPVRTKLTFDQAFELAKRQTGR